MESRTDINFKGLDITVYYDYQPPEPMVMYYSDGSGYPGCPEEFCINKVMLDEYDITELCEDYMDKIEEALRKYAEEYDNDHE